MPYLDVNDIHLYYEEQGAGAPLVLLHGGTGALEADSGWGRLTPLFAERYRVISVEHRGHGRTDNPTGRLDYALLADDLAAFIDRLGLAPAHVAGMSDGGIGALELGLTRPHLARTLVGVGVNYRVDERIRATLSTFTPGAIERDNPAWAAELARLHDPHHHPGYWRELVRQVAATAAASPTYTDDDLRRIATPALLIAGEDDPIGNLEQLVAMKRLIPGAEILVVNHAWHIAQHTHPQVVGPAILDFLARHSGPGD